MINTLKHWLWDVWSGVVMENMGPFCWTVPAAGISSVCWAYFSDAEHISHTSQYQNNGFAKIQKTVVDQMGSRPPNSDHDTFLVDIWLWEVLRSFISVQPLRLSLRSDQSLSHVQLFATPWIAAHQASLSITTSRSSLKFTSIKSVMPSSHLILSSPLHPVPNPFQLQSLFQWVNSSHEVAKVLEFQV